MIADGLYLGVVLVIAAVVAWIGMLVSCFIVGAAGWVLGLLARAFGGR